MRGRKYGMSFGVIMMIVCLMFTIMPNQAALTPTNIMEIEFDGNESTQGWYFGGSNYGSVPVSDFSANVEDGHFVYPLGQMGNHLRYQFPTPIPMEGRTNITFEAKFTYGSTVPQGAWWFFRIYQENTEPSSFVRVMSYNGNLQSDGTVFYQPEPYKTYIMKVQIDFVRRRQYLTVHEEGSNPGSPLEKGFLGTEGSTVMALGGFGFQPDTGSGFSIDYIKIYDGAFGVAACSVSDNQTDVPADSEILFSVNSNIVNPTEINVKNQDDVKVAIDVAALGGNDYKIVFPVGLEYLTKYTLSFPESLTDSEGNEFTPREISFKTEKPPFFLGDAQLSCQSGAVDELDDLPTDITHITASVDYENASGMSKNVVLIIGVYDADQLLTKMQASEETVAATQTAGQLTLTLDGITGQTARKAKVFVWEKLTQLH